MEDIYVVEFKDGFYSVKYTWFKPISMVVYTKEESIIFKHKKISAIESFIRMHKEGVRFAISNKKQSN